MSETLRTPATPVPRVGDEVLINIPDESWPHGEVGLVTVLGKIAARVQLSSTQGSAIVRIGHLEV